ncbi:MAG: glycosyltransferase [Pirellulales bacterium]
MLRRLASTAGCIDGMTALGETPRVNGIFEMSSPASLNGDRTARSGPTICQLVHGLPVGGAEVLIDRIVRRLCSRYRFIVACLDEVGQLGEILVQDGVRVVHLERRPGFDWKCVRRLRHLLGAEGVQIVHAHQCTPLAYALATQLLGRRPPVLLTEHGRFFPDTPSRKRKLFNRLFARAGDRFVAVGQTVQRALVENEGLASHRIQVVYNGIEWPEEEITSIDRAQMRAKFGVTAEQCLVVQVARLDAIKDHQTALRAIALAAIRDNRIRLFVVGDGPESEKIEREIVKQSLQERVTMLGMRSDVRQLLAAADMFLLSSVSEGIPVTILEAMAAGVPVVATAVGGVPELIRHEEHGLLAPAGDAAGLADALVRLAREPELRARFARNARLRAATDFSEQSMITHYDRIYQGMLARGRSE